MIRKFLLSSRPLFGLELTLIQTAVRVFIGLSLAFAHGLGKLPPPEPMIQGVSALGFPNPFLFAWAAALAEFGGGIFLALGLFCRPAALSIAFTMAVAAFGVHGHEGFAKMEMALLYLAISSYFVASGAGRLSVDAYLER